MFLLLPLILAAWCFYKRDSHVVPVIFIGLVAGVLVCGFKAFFLYSHRIIPYSFGANVAYLLIRQTLLPVLLVYGIFCVWSRDSFSYKAESFGPLLLAFYSLYLPYTIISTSDHIFTTFPLLLKPGLFGVMILILSFCVHQIEKSFSAKKYVFLVLWSIISIVVVVIPSLIEGMYILDMNYLLILVLSAFYASILIILTFIRRAELTE